MKLEIDVRGVKPDILSRLAGDIEAGAAEARQLGHAVLASALDAIAAGIRAAMQSGMPESVSVDLTHASERDLSVIGDWAQDLRNGATKSLWPGLAEIFNGVMIVVRDEEVLRQISARRELRVDDDGDDGQDDGWGDKLESEPAPGQPREE